jgi:uncharacterized protein YdeI (YjbR/CyaY-like superfamily)
MKAAPADPIFFTTPAEFRAWLRRKHRDTRELWVGFHRKASGRPSITWPEAVDEALCVGWIDGLRKTVDEESYKIRFTPRSLTSNWSAINIRRAEALRREGRMQAAGVRAFERRVVDESRRYSYEDRRVALLDETSEKQFRSSARAWEFFQTQIASYRKTAIWWVTSAKRPATRQTRLTKLINASKAHRKIFG